MLGKIINQKIEILASHNMGFLVKIGCATLVYSNYQDLLGGLRKYLSDPKKWEKKYNELNCLPQTPGGTVTWNVEASPTSFTPIGAGGICDA